MSCFWCVRDSKDTAMNGEGERAKPKQKSQRPESGEEEEGDKDKERHGRQWIYCLDHIQMALSVRFPVAR